MIIIKLNWIDPYIIIVQLRRNLVILMSKKWNDLDHVDRIKNEFHSICGQT